MFAKLKIKLDDNTLDYTKSSMFQGILFEKIDTEYADYLHQQSFHPYSQGIIKQKNNEVYWCINTLSKDAYEKIIIPLLDSQLNEVHIKKIDKTVKLIKKELQIQESKELTVRFYSEKPTKKIKLDFYAPVSFKQNGYYQAMPDLRLIYQNLMNRYSSINDMEMFDSDTLEELLKNSSITKYRIHSASFPMEGTYVVGCVGSIIITFFKNETVSKYARLLFDFAEYAGIGVKTSMGMGMVKKEEL
ncbi:CRISPR-associated endoribonuclease Cas6 [Lachnobacterium bovis]|uniref:CRISPR-associated endoribonuclease Cas6 n=1 Tax=Lachnobacterium bovis TaxID=140626 RepID=A0A1H9S214_9FIRM|nr:CRISPR-associated endoribonuclease Cas6 [Lachnobacterium bovis]SER78179.1 CRISPR-associated endoribonuclease Cas6 [Lachnobacterium bovis]